MCEISKSQRRTYRDQDPPRILKDAGNDNKIGDNDNPMGTMTTEKVSAVVTEELEFFRKHQQHQQRWEEASITAELVRNRVVDSTVSCERDNNASVSVVNDAAVKVPSLSSSSSASTPLPPPPPPPPPSSISSSSSTISGTTPKEVITNGLKRDHDSCEFLTNGEEMAPIMGVPPPPPAPHMGPDGLILPRKPYNPCLISNNHKDLRRELLFNQKIGKNVLNQKSELQRALERQREAAMRRETERNREESYKDDPRTALQRALEQRARQIQLMEHPPAVEPPNPLVTARAKLRTRTDSQ
ncbi:CCAAT/enhancer-binding protein alpha [Microplitis demolitor]|uniref:CCAAT/enhancer-binding protein alpha n=1 Tax=Microplitis demolitor TaxID=69319 RepID=UPI0004CCE1BA|nr:CCAAT/enhancer-binding protein alpha [Microplitis demolitor]